MTGAVSYTPLPADAAAGYESRDPHPGQKGTWYEKRCGGAFRGVYWIPDGAAGPGRPAVDPRVLAEEAYRYLPLPEPAVRMNPPVGRNNLVRLKTWLWVDPSSWGERTSTASVPGVTVTARARPVKVTWGMGNGDRVVCNGPGTPYDTSRPAASQSTTCGYEYRHTSAAEPGQAYTVTATVEWEASWSASGVAGGGALPAVRRTTTVRIPVMEVQSLNY